MSKTQKILIGGGVAVLAGAFMAHFGLLVPGVALVLLGVVAIITAPFAAVL